MTRPGVFFGLVFALGCGDSAPADLELARAEQDVCLEEGALDPSRDYFDEELDAQICACVVATDARAFAMAQNVADAPAPEPDVRIDDPDFAYFRAETQKTRCGCCHNATYEGPGTAFWDATFAPVWTDSVTDRRLLVLAGLGDKPGQTLPFPNMKPFQDFVTAEVARRENAR